MMRPLSPCLFRTLRYCVNIFVNYLGIMNIRKDTARILGMRVQKGFLKYTNHILINYCRFISSFWKSERKEKLNLLSGGLPLLDWLHRGIFYTIKMFSRFFTESTHPFTSLWLRLWERLWNKIKVMVIYCCVMWFILQEALVGSSPKLSKCIFPTIPHQNLWKKLTFYLK